MPLQYPTPKPLVTPPQALSVVCVRVDIQTPVIGESQVSYHFESYDASGNMVEHRIYTESFSTIIAEDSVGFNAVRSVIKPRAYSKAIAAGYPAGGIIS